MVIKTPHPLSLPSLGYGPRGLATKYPERLSSKPVTLLSFVTPTVRELPKPKPKQ